MVWGGFHYNNDFGRINTKNNTHTKKKKAVPRQITTHVSNLKCETTLHCFRATKLFSLNENIKTCVQHNYQTRNITNRNLQLPLHKEHASQRFIIIIL